MAAKKSAVDRVISELLSEKDAIDRTIARLRSAQTASESKKKARKPREVAAPTEGPAR